MKSGDVKKKSAATGAGAKRGRKKKHVEIDLSMTDDSRNKSSAIRMHKIGATWWGQRWIDALEHLSRDYLNRLGRGRADARAGRVQDLHIAPGKVSAHVWGRDDEIFEVTLRVAMLSPASWQKVIATMSQQAVFSAELLAGRMPMEIDDAFRASGHSLFLVKQRELETDCSCDDWASPCKHVAAVHYVLGEAFDKDPFLLFELRGRTKQQVLGALRALRSGQDSDELLQKLAAGMRARAARTEELRGASLADFHGKEYESFPVALPTMHFRFEIPAKPGAVIKQLGMPPSWDMSEQEGRELLQRLEMQLDRAANIAGEWAMHSKSAK